MSTHDHPVPPPAACHIADLVDDDAAREEQQDRELTQRAHASGDHQWRGVDCGRTLDILRGIG